MPGWDVEEKFVCTKYIDKKDIEFGKIVKAFYKKNGDELFLPKDEIEFVNTDVLIKTQKKFHKYVYKKD